MKRVKGYKLMLVLVVFLLTGCSNKLKCEIDTNNYTSKVIITYKGDKPITYNFKDKMLFSLQDAEAEIYYHSKYTEYGTLIAEKYAKMRNAPEYVSLNIKYDFTKNKSNQEDKILISKDDSKEKSKIKLESLGYKCK